MRTKKNYSKFKNMQNVFSTVQGQGHRSIEEHEERRPTGLWGRGAGRNEGTATRENGQAGLSVFLFGNWNGAQHIV